MAQKEMQKKKLAQHSISKKTKRNKVNKSFIQSLKEGIKKAYNDSV